MLAIAIVAAICSTTASMPQLLGKTTYLSNFTMFIRCLGTMLWAIYGTIQSEYVLTTSAIVACLVEVCLIYKTNCTTKNTTKNTTKTTQT